ncbi:hypothetical protein C8R45DRAFT_1133489 [Mycena sanguinolenta]|nr:hypothetical protein C8R45DRAFT_1133489 [Mycena sanguinolenta]
MASAVLSLLPFIFAFAIEKTSQEETNSLSTSPMTISHTCRRWQQIALGTGSLWTNIILTFPSTEKQLIRTSIWLKRSTTYPLDILLDFRDPEWDWEDEDTHEFRLADMEVVLRLLLPSAERWRTVELLTDTWAPIFGFLMHTRAVETLHLARCNAYFARRGQMFEPSALGHHLPLFGGKDAAVTRLQEVTLTGVHIHWSTAPFLNLTKLEFKYQAVDVMPTLSHLAQILAVSPNLEILAIVGHGPQFPPSTVANTVSAPLQDTITLPRLAQFTFGFVDVNDAMELLALFTFPALCELSLEDRRVFPLDSCIHWNSTTSTPIPSFTRFYGACTRLSVLRLYEVFDGALESLGTELFVTQGGEFQPYVLPRLDTLIVRGVNREIFTAVVRARGTSLNDSHFQEHDAD